MDAPAPAPWLDDLNPAQREAVAHVDGPLLVVAGAGSGKTRVLTHRIVHLLHQRTPAGEPLARPDQILAITFTNKAAAEMRERVEGLVGPAARSMWLMTFHAACGRILRREAGRLGYESTFSIYDQADQVRLTKRCIEALDLDPKRFVPNAVHHEISTAKNQLTGVDEYRSGVSNFYEEKVAEIYRLYDEQMRASNAMDFDDMLVNTVRLLEQFDDVRERWQSTFRYILVDEYQDTNRAQYQLLRLLGEAHGNICCVGDADQSIYSWRGADIRNITDFEADFPDARVVVLDLNYRSTGHILEVANGVIANNADRIEKRLRSDRGEGEPVRIVEVEDEHAEARLIASRIELAIGEGHSARDIAVFYRTNAQSRVIEDTLQRQGRSFQVIGGPKFYERAEVKDALAYLACIVNPADALALARIINTPKRGIGQTTIDKLQAYSLTFGETLWTALEQATLVGGLNAGTLKRLEDFVTLMRGLREEAASTGSVAALIELVYDRSGLVAALAAEDTHEAEGRIENLGELVNVAREYDQRAAQPRLDDFLQGISLQSDADTIEDEGGNVTLMTMHNAKGLEYPVVFVAGMEEGLFPHSRSINEGNVEEERRLCYVGITRAREQLTMTHATSRAVFGRRAWQTPSRFLDEMPAESIERARREATTWGGSTGYGGGFGTGRSSGFGGGYGSSGGYGGGSSGRSSRAPAARTSGGYLGAGGESSGSAAASSVGGAQARSVPDVGIGSNVRHEKFGEGVVIGVERGGELAVIRFASDGAERRLMLAYAPLEVI